MLTWAQTGQALTVNSKNSKRFEMADPVSPAGDVETNLSDLTNLSLHAIRSCTKEDLGELLDRMLRRIDAPGTSISGYNGAGGLSGDRAVDIHGRLG
jgi:hypothetical protein